MKQLASVSAMKVRFDRASQVIEARFGHRPAWFKIVVFVPVLIAFSAVLVALVYGLSLGLYAIRAAILQH